MEIYVIFKTEKMAAAKTTPLGKKKVVSTRLAPVFGLVFILCLGACLRFYQLGGDSVGNTYYAAAVKSMLTSWHNFFFVAFEPGGSVTVDKPPLGLWVQAISASFLGINGFALALPQALAGVFSILLLYHLVRRQFGIEAGLMAALVLALLPVTVATERNNTMDGLLVFVLLGAAWAYLKAAETGRLRLLLLGSLLIGLGFNIKMLQAVMPLPAFYTVYLLGKEQGWWKRLQHLALATLLFLTVALAWVTIVDLTPADQRPYVGSSKNNTVMELIIGHNGLSRLGLNNLGLDSNERPFAIPNPSGHFHPPEKKTAPQDGIKAAQANGQHFSGQPFPQRHPDGDGRHNETGFAGLTRLFQEPLVTEASWLLPLSLLGMPLIFAAFGWSWPLREKHLSVLIWVGWLLPSLVYFSFTRGLFHRYYLIMLGPPLAAICGITLWAIRRVWQDRPRLAWLLLFVLSGSTLAFEILILRNYPAVFPMLTTISAILWFAGILWLFRSTAAGLWQQIPVSLVMLSLLVAPFIWSLLTALNPHPNVALPTAVIKEKNTRWTTPNRRDGEVLNRQAMIILAYTQANTAPDQYLLATNTAREAAPFILEAEQPVLTFGGFTGEDDVVTLHDFRQGIASGELRFVLGLPNNKPEISRYIERTCTVVDLPGSFSGVRKREGLLYDCGR